MSGPYRQAAARTCITCCRESVHRDKYMAKLLEPPVTDYNRFQRVGAAHNSGVGRAFEDLVCARFRRQGIELQRELSVPLGSGALKKAHRFDLGSERPATLIECKSHTWTSGGNSPSAKMTVWNEAMYYFHLAPSNYRKAFFVLKHERRGQSLGAYYLTRYGHLVPDDVELWEMTDDGGENRLR